jgi:hypothetical protein
VAEILFFIAAKPSWAAFFIRPETAGRIENALPPRTRDERRMRGGSFARIN